MKQLMLGFLIIQTWLSAVSKPDVVTHLECVIVAGGAIGNDNNSVATDEIGVLNWVEILTG